jgi:hypothetical protein
MFYPAFRNFGERKTTDQQFLNTRALLQGGNEVHILSAIIRKYLKNKDGTHIVRKIFFLKIREGGLRLMLTRPGTEI